MKYKCLILDHDDTSVDSTAYIHYPAHVEVMEKIRPDWEPVSLDGWFQKNFHPGIMDYLKDELAFDQTELQTEYDIWRAHNLSKTPRFYPGFLELLIAFREKGGLVTVVSHSEVDIIKRHYDSINNHQTFVPDTIFGWDNEENRRKPNPYPVNQILKKYGLQKEEALIVDDLKPGVMMAKAAGVPIAGAGWGHQIPQIRDYMEASCDHYFTHIDELKDLLFN